MNLKNLPLYYKGLVSAVGVSIIYVTQLAGIVPGTWSVAVLGALTTLSVILVPNDKPVPAPVPTPPAA